VTCATVRPRLLPGLEPTDADATAHLAACLDCRRWLEGERALTDVLEARLPQHPASMALKRRLAERYALAPEAKVQPARRRWPVVVFAAAALAAVLALWFVRPSPSGVTSALAREALDDHLRVVGSTHPVDIESGGIHQVKPWFTGKLDFAPALAYAGDDDFVLEGGALALFAERKAAAFIFKRRLHVISLFVFPEADAGSAWPAATLDLGGVPASETSLRGYHVIVWHTGGQGYALVSDVAVDELQDLGRRIIAAR